VDDSLSTNVLPTLAAMDSFPGRRVALIAGGHDPGIDYAPLAARLAGRGPPAPGLPGPDSGPPDPAGRAAGRPAQGGGEAVGGVEGVGGGGVAGAVGRGFGWARPDGVVLLSPAAPSFGRYRDYADRGEAFARAMAGCRG